jgi:hypothetical protein
VRQHAGFAKAGRLTADSTPLRPPAAGDPTRRTGTLRAGLAVAAALVLLGTPAAVAAHRFDRAADATWVPGSPVAGRAAAAVPDGPSDPATASARTSIDTALADQNAALTSGDAGAFLAPVEPPLRDAMRRRFDALRAIKATDYAARLAAPPMLDGGRWRAGVEIRFCAGAAGCAPAPVQVDTVWVINGDGARLVEWGQSTRYGPRPWEVSELRAVVGSRVVVAASPRHASRLKATLTAAERAAAKADRFARWRPAPARYVVYLAGADEWESWYGGRQPDWAAGYTLPITPDHSEIVLNAGRVDAGEVTRTLTHEFAHVTTLAGVQRNYTDSWLLVEGLAEYVTHAGRPESAYPWLAATRRYVTGGRWPGTAGLAAPAGSATVSDATGLYGVAYLAVRRLADRFGSDRLLAFFAAVARDGRSPAKASPEIFGVPWTDAAADCDRHIRAAGPA